MKPVGDGEFAAVMAGFAPFAVGRRVAVAVSGGADSMALALLARRWGEPVGFIADHGLRAGSGAEAARTQARLAAMGVPARILTLDLTRGPALAERARQARYAALLGACAEAGLTDLLLGHHARDQAETVLMRRARSGREEAGMAPVRLDGAARLLRPLLSVAPGRLRASLAEAGIGWEEDPSNQDQAAERVRWRMLLDDPDGDGAQVRALLGEAGRAADRRASGRDEVAAWLARHATVRPEGVVVIPAAPLPAGALSAVIQAVSGATYPAAREAVARLAAGPVPATLGGARLILAGRLGQGMAVIREAAAMAGPVVAGAGMGWPRMRWPRIRWDGRFRIGGAVPDGEIGALGRAASEFAGRAGLPAAVLRTLPVLRAGGGIVMVHPALERPGLAVLPVVWDPARPMS